MITTVIFDAEGVIIDTQKLWQQADIEFLFRRKITADILAVHEKIVGTNLVVGSKIMQGMFGFPGDPNHLADERLKIITGLFKAKIDFIPGFQKFYAGLQGKYKTGIATAIKKELLEIVERKLPLNNLFHGNIYHIADVGNLSKPDPAIFLYAAKRLNAMPEECVVIEDAPNGIEGAKRAGMKCIALTTSFPPDKLTEADLIVDDYSKINLNTL